ncbi:MAG: rhodanese-like domain-containing protein [Phycisphaerales bacterium]|nr:rhodanese-like domain-containing protein [Phycisphaerales bacterium]
MKRLPLLLACLLAACTPNINDTDVEKEALTASQVRALVADKPDKTLLIDSRTPADYAAGHIPGAVNITVAQVSGLEGDLDPRISRYSTLIVYGADPGSIPAKALGKRLIATGYKGVRFFPDGYAGWLAAGLPSETGTLHLPSTPAPASH